ncbi:MAG: hypothetical protein JNM56_00475 [Planctomycetia bacterium]|nr:hypothetical protein [Planctomycetia bacterium]
MQLHNRPFVPVGLFLLTLGIVGAIVGAGDGGMFSPGVLNARNRRDTALGGVRSHADIKDCAACHVPAWASATMAERCLECHDEVKQQLHTGRALHGSFANGNQCRACHTEHRGPDAALTNLAHFDHQHAAFQLTGKHLSVECQACHINNVFRGTAQTCVSCHAEPAVHRGKYGTTCNVCHSTDAWQGASINTARLTDFNHDATGFKLTGKHTATACQSCHLNNTFKGTAQSCVSCHAEPQVHRGKFGLECAGCHSTSTWKGATLTRASMAHFDHNTTAFKLTGKHTTVECLACHVNNTFKGTAQTCVSCHAEPKVHLGKYGTNCTFCHSTTTWQGAVFVHKFPINHGNKRQPNECTVCHTTPDYHVYTCYGCHKHERTQIARKHREVRLRPGVLLEQCAKCHSDGKERRRAEAPTSEVMLALLDHAPRGCPMPLAAGMRAAQDGEPWPLSTPAPAAFVRTRLAAAQPDSSTPSDGRAGQFFLLDWDASVQRLIGTHLLHPFRFEVAGRE